MWPFSRRTTRRPSHAPRRPVLEALEDRCGPASLSYSSYLPGNGVFATAVDGSGNVYVTGNGWDGPGAFVAKLNATGTAVDWVTNLGSSGPGTGIAVDASGNVYVAGTATGIPTTPNALAPTNPGSTIGFLSVLNPTGSGLLYSTWLPGSTTSTLGAGQLTLAIDHSGDATGTLDHVYLTGMAWAGLPTTAGAYQPNLVGNKDAFLVEIDPNLSGSASLLYGSYLGGGTDAGTGIAVDGSGNAYVTGWTRSSNFPTMNAIQAQKGSGVDEQQGFATSSVFVSTLNSSGTGLLFSTFFGGNGGTISKKGVFTGSEGDVYGFALALDSAGDVYVTGSTGVAGQPTATSFPTTSGAYDATPGGGFVFEIDPPAEGGGAAVGAAVLPALNGAFGGQAVSLPTLSASLLPEFPSSNGTGNQSPRAAALTPGREALSDAALTPIFRTGHAHTSWPDGGGDAPGGDDGLGDDGE